MQKTTLKRWLPFLKWAPDVNATTLKGDLMAGITGAVIVLPQGVAYALIAGLPAEYGLYTAIVTAIIAAIFGSSMHLISGPTAALSIVVMSVASSISNPSAADYLSIVITLTFLTGFMQLALGVLRLGTLINFISHTVVLGFTAGAAILIAGSQMGHFLGIKMPADLSFIEGALALIERLQLTHIDSLITGLITLGVAVVIRHYQRRWPYLLLGLLAGSLYCLLMPSAASNVTMVGALPGTLPPYSLPDFSPDTLSMLAPGAFAVALLGLIEAVSIARAIALRSGQRIDGSQEFIGQGLSNVAGSFFSCYAGSGSFTRSGANYDSGAYTPLSAIFAAVFTALFLVFAPQVTEYLPMPAMAGSILLIVWNLIDFPHIRAIIRSDRSETLILAVTFFSTLFIELEFAIYLGVFLSLALYLRRTSRPTMMKVAPVPDHPKRAIKNIHRYQLDECPQLQIFRIDGSIFFGAIEHILQELQRATWPEKDIKHVLIVGKGINFIDVAGAEMLSSEARRLEALGGRLVFSSLKGTVIDELTANGFINSIGRELFYDSPHDALAALIPELEQQRCDRCQYRIFSDCPPEPVGGIAADNDAALIATDTKTPGK